MLVIVSGAIANKPFNGGESWVRMSWLRGFEKLGCQVYFLEQIHPDNCVDESGAVTRFDDSVNVRYFRDVMSLFDLGGRAALVCDDGAAVHGATFAELDDIVGAADLLVNITGHLRIARLFEPVRRRAYIDIDPGFTQYWHAAGIGGAHLEGHDLHFTIGENIGTSKCTIPTSGIRWLPIRQPVVLDDWPVTEEKTGLDRFTTVASWRGTYGRVASQGRSFGQKAHEFRRILDLPARAGLEFEIALDIHPGDRRDLDALRAHGWTISNPKDAAGDPAAFRRYVQGSGAEFSVAQGIYVETRCGWFSDRTVRYLASGRPALVQETGFSRLSPGGEGLVTFSSLDEAAERARDIAGDYATHAQAARAVAETYFDSTRVLPPLVEAAQLAASR